MPAQDDTVEERLTRIEELLDRAIATARQYPFGRQILKLLGLT